MNKEAEPNFPLPKNLIQRTTFSIAIKEVVLLEFAYKITFSPKQLPLSNSLTSIPFLINSTLPFEIK